MQIYSITDYMNGFDNSSMTEKILSYMDNLPIHSDDVKLADIKSIEMIDFNSKSTILVSDQNQLLTLVRYIVSKTQSNKMGFLMFDANTYSNLQVLDKMITNRISHDDIIHVGSREMPDNALKTRNIKHYSMKEISFEGIEETCNSIMGACRLFSRLTICINLNVLDPAYSSSITDKSVGGLSIRELEYLLLRIRMINNIKICIIYGYDANTNAEIPIKIINRIIGLLK